MQIMFLLGTLNPLPLMRHHTLPLLCFWGCPSGIHGPGRRQGPPGALTLFQCGSRINTTLTGLRGRPALFAFLQLSSAFTCLLLSLLLALV